MINVNLIGNNQHMSSNYASHRDSNHYYETRIKLDFEDSIRIEKSETK